MAWLAGEHHCPVGRRGPARPGQALVEAALSLSLVLLLTVVIIEVLLSGHAWQLAVSAAQEGARVASAEDRTLTDGVRQARALLDRGLGARADGLMVTPACAVVVADRCQAESVAIQITGEAEIPLLTGVPLRLPLDVTVSMFVEGR